MGTAILYLIELNILVFIIPRKTRVFDNRVKFLLYVSAVLRYSENSNLKTLGIFPSSGLNVCYYYGNILNCCMFCTKTCDNLHFFSTRIVSFVKSYHVTHSNRLTPKFARMGLSVWNKRVATGEKRILTTPTQTTLVCYKSALWECSFIIIIIIIIIIIFI